jgi:hypothetical protein
MQYGRIRGGMHGEEQLYVNRRRERRQPAVMVVGPDRSQGRRCHGANRGMIGPSCHPRAGGDPGRPRRGCRRARTTRVFLTPPDKEPLRSIPAYAGMTWGRNDLLDVTNGRTILITPPVILAQAGIHASALPRGHAFSVSYKSAHSGLKLSMSVNFHRRSHFLMRFSLVMASLMSEWNRTRPTGSRHTCE